MCIKVTTLKTPYLPKISSKNKKAEAFVFIN